MREERIRERLGKKKGKGEEGFIKQSGKERKKVNEIFVNSYCLAYIIFVLFFS